MNDDSAWENYKKNVTPLKKEKIKDKVNFLNSKPKKYKISVKKENYIYKDSFEKIKLNFDKNVVRNSVSNLSPHNIFDKKLYSNLSREKTKFDAKLDLHGLTLDEAECAFTDFVCNNFAKGNRNLLVISGKGLRSKNKNLTIKNMLLVWAKKSEIKNNILYFSKAALNHGGSGAYYIILRRNK